MRFLELFLIAVGLSMDAFAVSVGKGLTMKKMRWGDALIIALFFGAFQAGMPLIGYFLGDRFLNQIRQFDHWIAFLLLAFIGGKMIWEAFHEEAGPEDAARQTGRVFGYGELTVLAIATSIDALAVGVTFALLPDVDLVSAVTLIGVTTFLLSLAGVKIGHVFGSRFEKTAQIAGGVILIGIGVKILLEHLGLLSF